MRFFFYGTLLDQDVAKLVLGRRLPPSAFVPAALPGFSRWRVKGGSYPIAVRDRRGEVEGAVVDGLSTRDVARLTAYEGPGYRTVRLRVRIGESWTEASVFEPQASRLQPSRQPWDLKLWQRRDKKAFVGRLRAAFNARPAYSKR